MAKAKIPACLKDFMVPIDSIAPDPANARIHPDANLDAIRGSLLAFGQQKPVVVDRQGVIVAGSGLYRAAQALGWKKIACVRTSLSGPKRTAYALADNRTAELAEWDETALTAQLRAIQESIDVESLGFTGEEISELLKAPAGAEQTIPEQWLIVVECESEEEQRRVMELLDGEGHTCRPMIS